MPPLAPYPPPFAPTLPFTLQGTVVHFSYNAFGSGFGSLVLAAKRAVSGYSPGGFTRTVWTAPTRSPSSEWRKASVVIPFGCCYTAT